MAEEPNDSNSFSWRMTCISPVDFVGSGIWLLTTDPLERQAIKVRARVFLYSAAANKNSNGTLRDVDIEQWPGNGLASQEPGSYLFVVGEWAHIGFEDWQEFDRESTLPETYQLTVKQPPNADQGRIVRTPGTEMAARNNQPFRVKFTRVERSVTGDYVGSKFLCLSVIYEFKIQGTVGGEVLDELWRPCHNYIENVDTPKVIHSWVSHHAGWPP